jgi:predicted transcriptional regulator
MRQPEVIGFQISPEKLAQLDLMAKAMNCDRSQVLSEAVDTYLRLANPDKRGTEPLNGGDVGSLVGATEP